MTNIQNDDFVSTSPCYVIEEKKLRKNLQLIQNIANQAGVEFILAFKAFALWKTFPIFKEYIKSTTASSAFEAQMAYQKFDAKAHTYSPAYESRDFETIMQCSSHITFNSLSQLNRFLPVVTSYQQNHESISLGIRVNPEYSEIETDIYNPCAPGSRFGILASELPSTLPIEIEGFHCHNHCESTAEAFVRSLEHLEAKFGSWLNQIKWINFGGGHLVTKKGYNTALLIETLINFKKRYPHLQVILEPGSAFAWQTGDLHSNVVDIVENKGIKTAILNVSFTCHMPDCLEMPYWPEIEEALTIPSDEIEEKDIQNTNIYRLGGNSCLSGDFMGFWKFSQSLKIGDNVIFKDMIHYTTVKTNMFNGIAHPQIVIHHLNGELETLRRFDFMDYLERMD